MLGAIWMESPNTWTFSTAMDSKVKKSTSHQRLLAVAQSGLYSDVARTHVRKNVEHIGLQVVVEFELPACVGGRIDVHRLVLGTVFNDLGVAIFPCLLEQRTLGGGRSMSLASSSRTLLLGLGLGEIAGDLACPLMRPGRALVGCQGNCTLRTRRHREVWLRAVCANRQSVDQPSSHAAPCPLFTSAAAMPGKLSHMKSIPWETISRSYGTSPPLANTTTRLSGSMRNAISCTQRTPWRLTRLS